MRRVREMRGGGRGAVGAGSLRKQRAASSSSNRLTGGRRDPLREGRYRLGGEGIAVRAARAPRLHHTQRARSRLRQRGRGQVRCSAQARAWRAIFSRTLGAAASPLPSPLLARPPPPRTPLPRLARPPLARVPLSHAPSPSRVPWIAQHSARAYSSPPHPPPRLVEGARAGCSSARGHGRAQLSWTRGMRGRPQ